MITEAWIPEVGHRMLFASLPREVRLGVSPTAPKGTLMSGWCENSGTHQLWKIIKPSKQDAVVEFVGYIT